MADWYYSNNGERVGPIDSKELRRLAGERAIAPDTLIWREGLPNWVPASKVQTLTFGPPPLPETIVANASAPCEESGRSSSRPAQSPASPAPTRGKIHFLRFGTYEAVLIGLAMIGCGIYIANYQSMRKKIESSADQMGQRVLHITGVDRGLAGEGIDSPAVVGPNAAPVAPLADGKPKSQPELSVPAKMATLRFKGLSLEMTPREVTEAAPKVNDEAVTPPGAVAGFWSVDPLTPPVSAIPDDATGLWYFGYSFAPKSQPPKRSEESAEKRHDRELAEALFGTIAPSVGQEGHWKRIGWVVVSFDALHRSQLAAIKLRLHYGPKGPMAIAPNDLKPDELAKKLGDSYDIPSFTPKAGGSGWEHVNRAEGWRADFACIHWTQASADAGLSEELLRWDDREIAEFASEVETARSLGGLAALGGNSDLTAVAAAASKLDTAWVLSVRRVTKSKDVELD